MVDKLKYYYIEKLNSCNNFGDIFELGREIIYKAIKARRAGLSLYLQDLDEYVLAYHIVGSNTIVINRAVLEAIYSLNKGKEYVNSYIFVVLTHEYLHSLGIFSEKLLRKVQYEICKEYFGEDHLTTKMIDKGIFEVFPELANMKIKPRNRGYEIIRDFDRSSVSYIS
ncbi:MAG TPA: hypothetical protein VKU94_02555 [Geobacterales bacterium]|nr:hypothetical protein [Geobacterales bacterium]